MVTTKSISRAEFLQLTRPLLGLSISRPWIGIGSSLFLEIGPFNGSYKKSGLKKSKFCIDIGRNWRIEAKQSVLFGSTSNDGKIKNGIANLVGLKIKDISVTGRIPELYLQISEGKWIQSFATEQTQPEWSVSIGENLWLAVKRGGFVIESVK